MIPEYIYQIIVGILFICVLMLAYMVLRRGFATAPDNTAHVEHVTQRLPVGKVSEITARNAVHTAFRESLIMQEDDRVMIFKLREMIVDKNATIVLRDEKIRIQSDLLIDQSQEMAWDKHLIVLQEGRIRIFEAKAAALLHDDYSERQHSIARDSEP